MNILIFGTLYEPDLGPSAPLFTLLSENLAQRGHQVTVIATVPHYPTGRVPPEFRKKWRWISNENGVKVIRIGIPSVDRSRLTKRLLQFICYQIGAVLAGGNLTFDVVLAVSPSLSMWLPFVWFVVTRRRAAVYSIQDVYPDVGISLGIFRHQAIIRVVTWLEKYCLKHSSIVQIISNSFRPGLHKLGVPDEKMALVYNWVDTDLIKPLPKNNPFSQENQLLDHFVISYAGNIGYSQGLDNVLIAAEQLADHPELLFVFVGDGAGREQLQAQAQTRKLRNVKFIPFQPRPRLPEVLASADVSLIMLKKGIGNESLPSKTFSIMASGRPLLVSVDEESESWGLVKRAGAGMWVPPEDPSALAKSILALEQDRALCNQLGQNGRLWAEQNHSPHFAAQRFEELLSAAMSTKNIH